MKCCGAQLVRFRLRSAGRSVAARRGISLLEVLISMFVLLVGLVGVAALIPAGRKEMLEGGKSDRAAALATGALHDLKVRGVLNPTSWYDQTTPANNNPIQYNSGSPYFLNLPCLIDPLGMAAMAAGTFSPPLPAPPLPAPIYRITLGPTLSAPARQAMADAVFRAQDDLVFDLPTGDVQPAFQKFFTDANNNIAKRLSEGNYSWMVTLVPTVTRDTYTASVAVFYQRNFIGTGGERVVGATVVPGSPDVTLGPPFNSPADLNVKTGEWLMLAGPPLTPPGANAIPAPAIYSWYQILSAPAADPTNPNMRQVTLAGADLPPSANVTQAWLFDGIIAVYQRTVQLQFQ